MDRGKFDCKQEGWKMTAGWVGRAEFDPKQERWKMTAGRGGVRLATSRGMEDEV